MPIACEQGSASYAHSEEDIDQARPPLERAEEHVTFYGAHTDRQDKYAPITRLLSVPYRAGLFSIFIKQRDPLNIRCHRNVPRSL